MGISIVIVECKNHSQRGSCSPCSLKIEQELEASRKILKTEHEFIQADGLKNIAKTQYKRQEMDKALVNLYHEATESFLVL